MCCIQLLIPYGLHGYFRSRIHAVLPLSHRASTYVPQGARGLLETVTNTPLHVRLGLISPGGDEVLVLHAPSAHTRETPGMNQQNKRRLWLLPQQAVNMPTVHY